MFLRRLFPGIGVCGLFAGRGGVLFVGFDGDFDLCAGLSLGVTYRRSHRNLAKITDKVSQKKNLAHGQSRATLMVKDGPMVEAPSSTCGPSFQPHLKQ